MQKEKQKKGAKRFKNEKCPNRTFDNDSFFLYKLNNVITERNLLQPNQRVLIAVSGGQDSICLLKILFHLKKNWNFQLGIVHCDHRWNRSSKFQAAHVAYLAVSMQIDYHQGITIDNVQKEGIARIWRYNLIQTIAISNNYTAVVTGHNASDRIETLIYNLTRGSGLHGLQSIPWQRSLSFSRFIQSSRVLKGAIYKKKTFQRSVPVGPPPLCGGPPGLRGVRPPSRGDLRSFLCKEVTYIKTFDRLSFYPYADDLVGRTYSQMLMVPLRGPFGLRDHFLKKPSAKASRPSGKQLLLIRPLLETTRTEIRDLLNFWKFPSWPDESNKELRISRNRIRHRLVPYIRIHYNPKIDQTLTRLAEIVQGETLYLEQLTHFLLSKLEIKKKIFPQWPIFGTYNDVGRTQSQLVRWGAEPIGPWEDRGAKLSQNISKASLWDLRRKGSPILWGRPPGNFFQSALHLDLLRSLPLAIQRRLLKHYIYINTGQILGFQYVEQIRLSCLFRTNLSSNVKKRKFLTPWILFPKEIKLLVTKNYLFLFYKK